MRTSIRRLMLVVVLAQFIIWAFPPPVKAIVDGGPCDNLAHDPYCKTHLWECLRNCAAEIAFGHQVDDWCIAHPRECGN